MTTTQTDTLWMSNSGEITCAAHGGSYLRAAVSSAPTARTHVTPMGRYTKVMKGDRLEWSAMGMGRMTCKSCR